MRLMQCSQYLAQGMYFGFRDIEPPRNFSLIDLLCFWVLCHELLLYLVDLHQQLMHMHRQPAVKHSLACQKLSVH